MPQLTAVFPEKVSMGATGGPMWRTEVLETGSGHEFVNQGWSQPRSVWDVGHAARLEETFGLVRAHYMVAGGMSNAFPFKDWLDYKCPDYSGTGVFGQTATTTFQFFKRYASGGVNFDRKIVLPKSGTVTVTGGAVASINYATGVVTMTSGTPTSWTGEFYCLCRYGTDVMQAQLIDGPTARRVVGWSNIQIREVRL